MKILVAEPLATAGLHLLQHQPGWEVVVSTPKEFHQHLGDADALIVHNAVRITSAVLNHAPRLKVIGRAGVGVDNLDIGAATAAGVLVMNTPGGNAVSVAEHTLALMLSLARSIPQVSAATKSGHWPRKRFVGSELREKVLGIIGLGSIGREVLRRAKAFDMRVIAFDPYVHSQTGGDLGVEMVELDGLYAQSDYITLHTALTPESMRMLSAEAFEKMKDGVRIVNCARGELIDQHALKAAIDSGKVGGAALDVFEKEPPDHDDPLLALDSVIATPHIGGSTEEAQEILGVRINRRRYRRHARARHGRRPGKSSRPDRKSTNLRQPAAGLGRAGSARLVARLRIGGPQGAAFLPSARRRHCVRRLLGPDARRSPARLRRRGRAQRHHLVRSAQRGAKPRAGRIVWPRRLDPAHLQSSAHEFHSHQAALGARDRAQELGPGRARHAAQRLCAIPPDRRTSHRHGRCVGNSSSGRRQPPLVDRSYRLAVRIGRVPAGDALDRRLQRIEAALHHLRGEFSAEA